MGFFDSAGGGLISGGASLIGGVISNVQNKREAERNRNWQAYMSNTSHQREVLDLKKAGLNPLLSGTGGSGASTPSGAQAQVENVAAPAISSAQAGIRLKQDIAASDASIDKTRAETKLSNELTKKTKIDAITATRNLPEAELKNKLYNYLMDIGKSSTNVKKQLQTNPSQTRTEQFLKQQLNNWDTFPNRN